METRVAVISIIVEQEDAIEELGGYYTEEEIRLVRIKFLSEMAN